MERSSGVRRPGLVCADDGFTLIELLFVVMLIAIISTLAVSRLDSILQWKQEGALREFVSTWQFLYNESTSRGESYRLVLNFDNNSYYVRREVQPEGTAIRQVDYLANLRTKSERARRAEKAAEDLLSLEEEFKEEDRRKSGALDAQYYRTIYADPSGPVRLGVPLEFPSLAQAKELVEGLRLRDAIVRGERINEGETMVRLSPRGASEFAVVHLEADDTVYTVVNDPATGAVSLHTGDLEFNWNNGSVAVR